MRSKLCPIVIAFVLLVVIMAASSLADTPSHAADAALYYSRRADPNGGETNGAVRPSLFTGAAQTSVDIELPPGTAGMTPKLSLEYSSQRGRAEAGHGWTLALPSIVRSTKYGADHAQDGLAPFELDGEELVASGVFETDPYGVQAARYHSKVERFQRILYSKPTATTDYWVVFSKDGTYQTFGRSAAARVSIKGVDKVTLSYEWRLEEVTEPHGLSWKAIYVQTRNYPRLDRIQYTLKAGAPVGELREVQVLWEPRPDARVDYSFGAERALTDRVSQVLVTLGGSRVRKYVLTYDPAVSSDSGSSLLRFVQMFGLTDNESLPATTFDYSANIGVAPGFSLFPSASFVGPDVSNGDLNGSKAKDLVDLDGDGLLDWIDASATNSSTPYWMFQRGHGTSAFSGPVQWPGIPLPIRNYVPTAGSGAVTPASVTTDLIDMNGDGLLDVFNVKKNTFGQVTFYTWEFYRNTGSSFVWSVWGAPSGYTIPPAFRTAISGGISGTWWYAEGRSDLVDLTGDGCPDYVVCDGTQWTVYRNKAGDPVPSNGFAPGRVYKFAGAPGPTYLWRTKQAGRVHGTPPNLYFEASGPSWTMSGLFELNGDGLIDFINGGGSVFLNSGRGFDWEWTGGSAAAATDYQDSLLTLQGQGFYDYPTRSTRFGLETGLLDINADGRPDWVACNADAPYFACREINVPCNACAPTANPSLDWIAYLNTGHSFRNAPTAIPAARYQAGQPGNVYPMGYLQSTNPDGCFPSTSYGFTRVADVDGSGVLDFIRVKDANWTIQLGNGNDTKGELLVRVSNGIGGTTDLTYAGVVGGTVSGNLHFPRSVLTSQVVKDGLNTVNAATPTTYVTDYTYTSSYYDRAAREFAGFGNVAVVRSDNVGSAASFEQKLFATGNPLRQITVPVSLDAGGVLLTETWTDGPTLAGLMVADRRGPYIGGPDTNFEYERWTPWIAAATNVPGSLTPRVPEDRRVYRDSLAIRKIAATAYSYDAYNNVTSARHKGDTATTSDDFTIRTDFTFDLSRWIFAPSGMRACSSVSCNQGVLREAKFFYDSFADLEQAGITKGDLRRIRTWSQFGSEPAVWPLERFEYDAFGNLVQEIDAEGAVTDTVYTASGVYPVQESIIVSKGKTTPVTLSTASVWDERFGVALTRFDENDRRESVVLDGLGRVIVESSSPPADPAVADVVLAQTSYSLAGAYGTSTDNYVRRRAFHGTGPADYLESYVYFDGLGRSVQEKNPAAGGQWSTTHHRTTYHGKADVDVLPFHSNAPAYTPLVLNESIPPYSIVWSNFDWAGRELDSRLRTSSGIDFWITSQTHSVWDSTVTNHRGFTTLYRSDAFGRTVLVREGDGISIVADTTYLYDLVGNLSEIHDANGNVTRMRYDSRGLVRETEDPNRTNCAVPASCAILQTYDLTGRKISRTDAKGQRTDESLDELGRVYRRHFVSAAEPDAVFAFDSGTPHALGRLVSAVRGAQFTVAYQYDNWGRNLRLDQTVAQAFGNRTDTLWKTYDLLGREATVKYPTGETASYSYGPTGALASLSFAGQPIISGVIYDAFGRPTQTAWGNGLFTNLAFGPGERLSTLRVENATATHVAFAYDYDRNGNPKEIFEQAGGWRRELVYDWADRPTQARYWMGPTLQDTFDYAYDKIGNVTYNSEWTGGGLDGSYAYGTSAGPSAVTKIGGAGSSYTLSYDSNGSLKSESTGAWFQYNYDGRVSAAGNTQVTPDPSAAYSYDAVGEQRVRKTFTDVDGVKIDLRYLAPYFEQERRADGTLLSTDRYLIANGQRVAVVRSGHGNTIRYIHGDLQGSVVAQSNDTGRLLWRRTYKPFGGYYDTSLQGPLVILHAPHPARSLRYGFTGAEDDYEINQLHMGVREHHSAIARWVSTDPIIPRLFSPQSLNPYGYADNRPTMMIDPTGYKIEYAQITNIGEDAFEPPVIVGQAPGESSSEDPPDDPPSDDDSWQNDYSGFWENFRNEAVARYQSAMSPGRGATAAARIAGRNVVRTLARPEWTITERAEAYLNMNKTPEGPSIRALRPSDRLGPVDVDPVDPYDKRSYREGISFLEFAVEFRKRAEGSGAIEPGILCSVEGSTPGNYTHGSPLTLFNWFFWGCYKR